MFIFAKKKVLSQLFLTLLGITVASSPPRPLPTASGVVDIASGELLVGSEVGSVVVSEAGLVAAVGGLGAG